MVVENPPVAQSVQGKQYVVVSGHAAATQAALDVLAEQGNLTDAAIASAAVLCAALPHACGLGGDCFILLHHQGKTYSLNGSGKSPQRLPADLAPKKLANGALSCAVPGMLGAWESLHQRFGKLPWNTLFGPAIHLARNGFSVSQDLGAALQNHRERLTLDPGCRALFTDDTTVPTAGQTMRQPTLANALSLIAKQGGSALYQGTLGQQLCQVVQAQGGVLAPDDLALYEPVWTAPLQYTYRGLDICVPPPNSYAVLLPLQLAALSRLKLDPQHFDTAQRLQQLIIAAQQSIHLGRPLLADPDILHGSYQQLPPPALIEQLEDTFTSQTQIAQPFDSLPKSHGTALVSIADQQGNGITIIQSIFTPFGSHVADADTGIVLNNRLLGFSHDPDSVNFARAHKRPAHTLSPAIVLKNGKLNMLLTTPGGSGQTITLAQVLTNVVDYKKTLAQAISQPRWSLDLHGNLLAEGGIPAFQLQQLNDAGIDIQQAQAEHRFFFGSAECIAIHEDMTLTAVADYRRDAYAGGQ